MAFVLQLNYGKTSIVDFLLYTTEDLALQAAAAEIQDNIYYDWDFTDYSMALEANKINDLVKSGDYVRAINEWNSTPINSSKKNVQMSVYWQDPHSMAAKPRLFDKSDFVALVPPSLNSNPPASVPPTVKPVATSSNGASCRVCRGFNQYAIPDSADGTFVCYSCKS